MALSHSGSHFISPTLQANWNQAISDCINCFNAHLLTEAWDALQTLHDILPPPIYDEEQIKAKFKSIDERLENCRPDSVSFGDQVTALNNSLELLEKEARPFFRMMYKALYDGNYLDAQFGPRHAQTDQRLGRRDQNAGAAGQETSTNP